MSSSKQETHWEDFVIKCLGVMDAGSKNPEGRLNM